ncbi:hypothetical protein GOEFS_055_00340 [Gordonia effusa NBRC 100432]|uniref:Uncharacterized protein n=1 Tax=Gordonia effusa NBRC 100432 TaxID=1077974 RepID=H0R0C0_9ACTN|nr:hypothetical protein [Gordonia effusa]GAB18521.1 hypothetical protein GOEFS_055_00340 [Gordonia effusa NBRC 100432]
MAEPSNSDTVANQDDGAAQSTDTPGETDTATPKKSATPAKSAVPVKASPLQKSFLERRKTRTRAAEGESRTSAPQAGTRARSSKTASRSGEVRRAAANRDKIIRIGSRVLAGVVLVAVLVLGTLFGIGKYRADQRDELRAEYSAFAEQVTVNLTTLTPSNAGRLQKTLLEQTSGYAKQQMEQAANQTVELVKQGKLNTKTTVLSTAVTRAEPDRGSAIMVFGWTSKPDNPNDELVVETYRWRVDMTRINGQLKMTNFEWVT